MRAILPSLLAAVLLVPANARAEVISIDIGPEPSAFFGPVPFSLSDLCDTPLVLDECTFELVSGPLLNLTVNGNETIYTYGEGTVSMTVSGLAETDEFLEGTLVGTTQSFDLSVCEGCDEVFGGGLATAEIFVFPGSGDVNFVKLFGQFLFGFFEFSMDGIEGDPTTIRHAFSGSGFAQFDMIVEKTVPEPSVLMFGLTAAGMLIARRRRRTLHA